MKMTGFEKRFVNSEAHSRRVAAAALRRLEAMPISPGQRLLDVGCGNGIATLHVARSLDVIATGVDVDPDQIALARSAAAGLDTNMAFQVANATRLPFADATFDIVTTSKTLHHIKDWQKAVAELVRVVKPGGYIVLADLVAPAWTGAILKSVLRRSPVATASALKQLARTLKLEPRHECTSGWVFEAAWQKHATTEPWTGNPRTELQPRTSEPTRVERLSAR